VVADRAFDRRGIRRVGEPPGAHLPASRGRGGARLRRLLPAVRGGPGRSGCRGIRSLDQLMTRTNGNSTTRRMTSVARSTLPRNIPRSLRRSTRAPYVVDGVSRHGRNEGERLLQREKSLALHHSRGGAPSPSGRCSASPNSKKCRQSASCASSPKTRRGNRRLLGGKKASQFPTLFLLVLAATIAAINRTHTYGSVGWTAERYWGGALQTIVRISSEGPSR
jgi:hypothetical protein